MLPLVSLEPRSFPKDRGVAIRIPERYRNSFITPLYFGKRKDDSYFSGKRDSLAAGQQTQRSDQKKDATVYVTRTGKKYHRAGCSSLSRSSIPMTLKDAKARGYTACKLCRPQQ
jgi:hypothetical protein